MQWEPSYSLRTDGQTDMMGLIVAFRNFAKVLKNERLQEGETVVVIGLMQHKALVDILQGMK